MSFLNDKKHFVVESDVFGYKWHLRSSWKHSWKIGFFFQWTFASFELRNYNTFIWCLHMLPHCAHGQSQDAHSNLGLWTQYFLCGHFLDVTKAAPEVVVGNMTHELGSIHALRITLITNCSCFYSSQTHYFPIVQCTNSAARYHHQKHASPNQHVSREIFLWMNEKLFLNLRGNSWWPHLYLALHKEGFDYLPPTFQFLTTT